MAQIVWTGAATVCDAAEPSLRTSGDSTSAFGGCRLAFGDSESEPVIHRGEHHSTARRSTIRTSEVLERSGAPGAAEGRAGHWLPQQENTGQYMRQLVGNTT